MQTRMSDQRPQKGSLQGPSQRRAALLSCLRSPWFGYIAGLLLAVAVVYGDNLYNYISSTPIFDGAPFGLISVVVALL
jgi:hypothetical protein